MSKAKNACAGITATKSDKVIPSTVGTILINNVFAKAGAFSDSNLCINRTRGPQPTFSDQDILRLASVSLGSGHPDFVDVNEFLRARPYYGKFLGVKGSLPSEPTVRLRLNALADEMRKDNFAGIWAANYRMLNKFNPDLGLLDNGMMPVDMDVSPFDNSRSNKEGVSWTYKQFMGYSPMFAYMGTKGYTVGVELREGSQHCQKDTPAFLQRVLKFALASTDRTILVRYDSGNDAVENLRILVEDPRVRFLGKHNFRGVDKHAEARRLMNLAAVVESPRPGKKVYTGSTVKTFAFTNPDMTRDSMTVRAVFQVTERFTDAQGQYFLEPELELDMWFTNLSEAEASDDEVIELYHQHGTMEQFHSEFKTDMDLERLPSGKFNTNALILQLAMLGYNALRIIEMTARRMPKGFPIHFRDTRRRRLRTIIEELIRIPAHITCHARKITIDLGCCNPWADVFLYVDRQIRSAA